MVEEAPERSGRATLDCGMVAMRIREKAGCLQRHAADGIGLGDVAREPDRVGARLGRGRAEIVDVAIAEGVGDDGIGMQQAEPRVV